MRDHLVACLLLTGMALGGIGLIEAFTGSVLSAWPYGLGALVCSIVIALSTEA